VLIEGGFYKLPELLTSNFAHRDTYEGTIVNAFSTCLLMELNSRNIPNPYEHIYTEKPYPTIPADQPRWRADLFLDLQRAIRTGDRMALYGVRELNWIEVKAFFESTRGNSTPPKTAHAGRALRDLLRLALLPEELQGSIRQNGRYLLAVFANKPQDSLAFTSGGQGRPWLESMFTEGYTSVEIDLAKEPESLRTAVGQGFGGSPELRLVAKIHTHVFQPDALEPSPVFFGYLLKLRSFRVETPVGTMTFDDKLHDQWDAGRIEQLRRVRMFLLSQVRSAE
jgi:hypothetical protein